MCLNIKRIGYHTSCIVSCDFCGTKNDHPDAPLFVAAPSKQAHICDACVSACTWAISRKVAQDRRETTCAKP